MTDVFISYKQEERERIQPIAAALRALKVEVWFDERLSPDKAFTEEIENVANTCGAQLVCWSPAAVKSEWVRGEAEVGRQRGTLVQAMIERCTLAPPFNVLHAEDISDWRGEGNHGGWQKLLEAIGRKIERPGLAALALIHGSPIADDWKNWANKYPADPLAEEAWARAEELHLNAEKDRLAKEWRANRKRADDERRRATDARRRSAPLATQPQHLALESLPARRSWVMPVVAITAVVISVSAVAMAYLMYTEFRADRVRRDAQDAEQQTLNFVSAFNSESMLEVRNAVENEEWCARWYPDRFERTLPGDLTREQLVYFIDFFDSVHACGEMHRCNSELNAQAFGNYAATYYEPIATAIVMGRQRNATFGAGMAALAGVNESPEETERRYASDYCTVAPAAEP